MAFGSDVIAKEEPRLVVFSIVLQNEYGPRPQQARVGEDKW